ncbi:MAG: hypothetical protein H6Q73_1951 [Firmicutes bacterium]|nr:hypothetical protein [Bacillota bacterium]
MLLTFPHMGTLYIVLETLFKGLDIEVLTPPPMTRETLEIGAKYSPETACLPFKMNLGNFIQSLSRGADTIITCGGEGPCRLGYYAEVQKNILAELGYKFKIIAIEPNFRHVWQVFNQLTGKCSWQKIYRTFKLAGAKLSALDYIERQSWFYRPCKANDLVSVDNALAGFDGGLAKLVLKKSENPLRIGIVGEIYVMLDNFINHELTQKLGRMGVEVYGTTLLGDYVRTHLVKNRKAWNVYQTVLRQALPYLGHYVGGHGIKSIGYTAKLAQEGFDGIIHVFPFTCMPEVIAKNILPEASRKLDIPVLSLAFDEQTGIAGMVTRLEAFVDLLAYRRRKLVQG